MKSIGISGLAQSTAFARATFPARAEREYRMTQGHDSAAALVVDGEVIAAAAEERFTGEKHTGAFPREALACCLDHAGLTLSDIDAFGHAFNYAPFKAVYRRDAYGRDLYDRVLAPEIFGDQISRYLPAVAANSIVHLDHHLCHAASVAQTSPFDRCLVLVLDGMGEAFSGSVYEYRDGDLQRIGQYSAANSLGLLYSLVTFHLGFDFNADEYKIMGLAPYGEPSRFRDFFQREVILGPNGGVSIPMLKVNRTKDEQAFYLGTRAYLARHLAPARDPNDGIDQTHRDMASALQERLEQAVLHVCGHFREVTGLSKLAYAGGVALNCSVNGKLRDANLFDQLFFGPASGDDGAAMGAALHLAPSRPVCKIRSAFLGPKARHSEIVAACSVFADRILTHSFDDLASTCAATSAELASGRVVAWHRGRMEFGARALGHRSILADPRDAKMRDRVNAMVKKREAFRPFAPAVLAEEASKWFCVTPGEQQPFMTTVVRVREDHRQLFPAITHVDGTARIQIVSRDDNPEFHTLLCAFRERSGVGMLLNTSFNVKGQPIVNTPVEAVRTFLSTALDCLVLEDQLITRRRDSGGEGVKR